MSAIQTQAGQQSPTASDLPLIHFGAVSAGEHFPPPASSGLQGNETMPGSLCEALLDGHIGEEARELLDDPHVYLRTEGDVQEEKSWARLEEFLQGGSTHQPCA